MNLQINDIIVVTGLESIPASFLGRYGRIVDVNEYKVTVEFVARIHSIGSLSHTVKITDIRKIGKLD